MAGPYADVETGEIECTVCGAKIPDREVCSLLIPAFNDNGAAREQKSRETRILCAHCSAMAKSNPDTDVRNTSNAEGDT